jgi:uncharacterized membrane protein
MKLPRAESRHWNFYLALACGALVVVATLMPLHDLSAVLGASVFSLAYLGLTARDMPRLTPDYLRRHAYDEDAPPFVVFGLTLAIVLYVTIALFLAINAGSRAGTLRLVLGVLSVVLSWLMINAMWGMHYAWEFYQAPEQGTKSNQRGGLDFPGDDLPDGMAFVYFSLVVAMTAQTSDTNVTSNLMRRIVSAQSLFGYLFNTVFVAAAVNLVV